MRGGLFLFVSTVFPALLVRIAFLFGLAPLGGHDDFQMFFRIHADRDIDFVLVFAHMLELSAGFLRFLLLTGRRSGDDGASVSRTRGTVSEFAGREDPGIAFPDQIKPVEDDGEEDKGDREKNRKKG